MVAKYTHKDIGVLTNTLCELQKHTAHCYTPWLYTACDWQPVLGDIQHRHTNKTTAKILSNEPKRWNANGLLSLSVQMLVLFLLPHDKDWLSHNPVRSQCSVNLFCFFCWQMQDKCELYALTWVLILNNLCLECLPDNNLLIVSYVSCIYVLAIIVANMTSVSHLLFGTLEGNSTTFSLMLRGT